MISNMVLILIHKIVFLSMCFYDWKFNEEIKLQMHAVVNETFCSVYFKVKILSSSQISVIG